MNAQYRSFLRLTKDYKWWNPVHCARAVFLAILLALTALMPAARRENKAYPEMSQELREAKIEGILSLLLVVSIAVVAKHLYIR